MPKVADYQWFGIFLRQVRKESGCRTQEMALERINAVSSTGKQLVSDRQLARFESGEAIPKIETTKAMAIAYECEEIIRKRLEAIRFSIEKIKVASVAAPATSREKQYHR